MAIIRIVRNEAANCITFEGTSVPAYFNACLSGEVSSVDPDKINIKNDIRSNNQVDNFYEFSNIHYTSFEDRDGNTFNNAQEVADYITSQGNVLGLNSVGKDLTGTTVNFRLDQTNTSIIMDNGEAFGVNTIKAVPDGGLIKIKSIGEGVPTGGNEPVDRLHFENLDHTLVEINGVSATGGLNDVVDKLNELFTVGAFEAVVIRDPYSTMVADVNGVDAGYTLEGSTAIDPVGDDIFTNSGSGNYAGLKSTATIDQAGEYFTFDIRGEGQIGFGLIHTSQSYIDENYSGSGLYANPSTFATFNSAHHGFQFSHWFHPTPNGSWTNYGANTAYTMGPAWYSANTQFEARDEWLAGNPIKIKVGIDENGFIAISSLANDGVTWKLHARTTYPVPQGSEFHLGIKAANSAPRVFTAPKVHLLEPAAPTMYFRYIESPDGEYQYPLFATTEEAEYYDTINGGAGTYHTHVYLDDPTYTSWYMPDNGDTHGAAQPPTSAITFEGNPINWTEISSLTNADLVPSTFTAGTFTVNELSAVNIQLHPVDAPYTTTIVDTDNSGLSIDSNGIHLQGTAPEVTGDNVANPSDTYTIEVVRTNAYGSSTGTLTLVVNNLTAPVTAISGFNHVTGSTAMIDADTMDDGSVVHVNTTVADGERFVIEKAYIETNILPNLTATNDMYIIGLANQPEDFSTLELSDFDTAIVWEYQSATSHTFKFYRDGSVVQNIVISSLTQALYDYAIEVNGTSAWLIASIASNVNSIMNEPSPADGGTFSHTYEATSIEDTAPVTIHMAALNTTGDISTTDIETITTPTPAPSNLTTWSKAIDFSGNSEHLKQVTQSTAANAIRMGGSATTVGYWEDTKTVPHSAGRPWSTAVVFKPDGNTNATQTIWNSGSGGNTGVDNIFVLYNGSTGDLIFEWGRNNLTGAFNRCTIATGLSSNDWHGVYVTHKGTRFNSGATAANLENVFDIRVMSSADSFNAVGTNKAVAANWTHTGAQMDRSVGGDFTIAGRGTNRPFYGKVASMVVTTLMLDTLIPTDAEIKAMITDPTKWLQDYKVGNSFRASASNNVSSSFAIGSGSAYLATQVWLMGDGTSDSYANGIRNQVLHTDQNYTKLQLNSMVSNDIENVTIQGLS